MPYIICVNQPGCLPEQDPYAVATIEEAREAARDELVRWEASTFAEAARQTELGDDVSALPEAGGTVGPLPDGYVIDVRYVPLTRLFDELRHSMRLPSEAATEAEIIDAYNGN